MIGTTSYRAGALVFDPALHTYRLPDGRRIPGVTEILGAVGVSTDFDALAASSSRLDDAVRLKRDLGHALHADAHAFDDDDLDWSTVDVRVGPYLTAWTIFRECSGAMPLTRERRVFHPTHEYAGTFDGIFRLPNGRRVLIDLKTGDPEDAGCRFQTAAYLAAHAVEHPEDAGLERWAVQLTPERAVPYLVFRYTDGWRDFSTFQAFITTYRHQRARRAEERAA